MNAKSGEVMRGVALELHQGALYALLDLLVFIVEKFEQGIELRRDIHVDRMTPELEKASPDGEGIWSVSPLVVPVFVGDLAVGAGEGAFEKGAVANEMPVAVLVKLPAGGDERG